MRLDVVPLLLFWVLFTFGVVTDLSSLWLLVFTLLCTETKESTATWLEEPQYLAVRERNPQPPLIVTSLLFSKAFGSVRRVRLGMSRR